MSIPQKTSSEKYFTPISNRCISSKCASEITKANKFDANSVLIKKKIMKFS